MCVCVCEREREREREREQCLVFKCEVLMSVYYRYKHARSRVAAKGGVGWGRESEVFGSDGLIGQ